MALLKNTIIYTIITAINSGMTLLLSIYLTRELLPEDYGFLTSFTLYDFVFTTIISLSLSGYVIFIFFRKTKKYVGTYVYNAFLTILTSGIFFLILAQLLRFLLGDFLKMPYIYYLLIPFLSVVASISFISLGIIRNLEKPVTYAKFSIVTMVINIGLTILLISKYKAGWQGRVFAIFASQFVISLFHLRYLYKVGYLVIKFDKRMIIKGLRYCLPLIPMGLAIAVMELGDRYIIDDIVGKKELGIYSIGYTFGGILRTILATLNMVAIPFFYKLLANKDLSLKRISVQATYIYGVVMVLLGVFVVIGSHIAFGIGVVGDKFLEGEKYISWIVLGYVFWGLFQLKSIFIVQTGNTKYVLYVSAFGAVINIGLNMLLIPIYGAIGAAYSTAACFFVIWILIWIVSIKKFPMPWFERDILKVNLREMKDKL